MTLYFSLHRISVFLIILFNMVLSSKTYSQELISDFDIELEPLRISPQYDKNSHEYKKSYINKNGYNLHLSALLSKDIFGNTPSDEECKIETFKWKITLPNKMAPQIIEYQYVYESKFPTLILQNPNKNIRNRTVISKNNSISDVSYETPSGNTARAGRNPNISGEFINGRFVHFDNGIIINSPEPIKAEIGTQIPRLGKIQISLTIIDNLGQEKSVTKTFHLKEKLVAIIGDSFTSGEGNPARDCPLDSNTEINPFDDCNKQSYQLIKKATLDHFRISDCWEEPLAHRSYLSGHMLAAKQLNLDDPYTTITYISFAHTGASIIDGLISPQEGSLLTLETAKSQIAELKSTIGDKKIDALIISIGVNDIKFSTVLEKWFKENVVENSIQYNEVLSRIDNLEAKYEKLNNILTKKLRIQPNKVIISEYPEDLFSNLSEGRYTTTKGCGGFDKYGPFEGILQREALLLKQIGSRLNSKIKLNAEKYGWNYVDGISEDFLGKGMCSSDPYFISMGESCHKQNDIYGTAHPNSKGHQKVKERILPILQNVINNN